MYAPNNRTLKYNMGGGIMELQRKIDESKFIVGDFNIPLLEMNSSVGSF